MFKRARMVPCLGLNLFWTVTQGFGEYRTPPPRASLGTNNCHGFPKCAANIRLDPNFKHVLFIFHWRSISYHFFHGIFHEFFPKKGSSAQESGWQATSAGSVEGRSPWSLSRLWLSDWCLDAISTKCHGWYWFMMVYDGLWWFMIIILVILPDPQVCPKGNEGSKMGDSLHGHLELNGFRTLSAWSHIVCVSLRCHKTHQDGLR